MNIATTRQSVGGKAEALATALGRLLLFPVPFAKKTLGL